MFNAYSIFVLLGAAVVAPLAVAKAGKAVTAVHRVTAEGTGQTVGKIVFEDSRFGLHLKPGLKALTAGPHAAHVHENAACGAMVEKGRAMPADTPILQQPAGVKSPTATAISAICRT
ncbi:MAG: hypothetical protein RLQ73_05205 [Hoeflea sp. D1-CHI-28]